MFEVTVTGIARVWPLLILSAGAACGNGTAAPQIGDTDVRLDLVGLRPLDAAREGAYEAWAVGSDGVALSAGRFVAAGAGAVTVRSPIQNPSSLRITVEPPGDDDGQPSIYDLLGGAFANGRATLTIVRSVTGVDDLEANPEIGRAHV